MADASDAHTATTPLKGRRALITGGTTGIGRAIAVLLASEGAKVFVCGRDPQHLDDALARIREVGEGDGMAIDLAEQGAPARFVEAGAEALGGIDILVSNAAGAADALSETDAAELERIIQTNFAAYLTTTHAAVERMNEGDVVLIGSVSAHILGPSSTIYAATKSGIAGFAEALRKDLGPKGVRVALVEPGLTGSDMVTKSPEEQAEDIRAEKMLRAEDIAVAVHFMLTQPRRSVVQQMTVVPRVKSEE